jgi:Spy/CpxP family protein refolding chaperone
MKRSMIFYFVTVLLLAFYAYGVQRVKYQGNWRWWEDKSFVGELNLNEDQVAKVEEISSSYKEKLGKLRSVEENKLKLYKETMGDANSTRKDILKAYDELWNARHGVQKAQLEMRIDMKGVLTPYQKTQLSVMKKVRKQKMMKKHLKPKE